MTRSFDVYVYEPCEVASEGVDLSPELRERLSQVKEDFLHLDFPTKEEAAVLARLIVAHGGEARVIDAAYREPRITLEQAWPLAEQELEALKAVCEPAEYDPLEFHNEDPMRWIFCAVSPELMARGKIPGALFPAIDKVDGHAWQTPEFDADAEELARVFEGLD